MLVVIFGKIKLCPKVGGKYEKKLLKQTTPTKKSIKLTIINYLPYPEMPALFLISIPTQQVRKHLRSNFQPRNPRSHDTAAPSPAVPEFYVPPEMENQNKYTQMKCCQKFWFEIVTIYIYLL